MSSSDTPASAPSVQRLSFALSIDPRTWIVSAVATAVAYLVTSRGFVAPLPIVQIPLFCGAIAGLTAATLTQGALVAGFVTALAWSASPPLLAGGIRFSLGGWLLGVAVAMVAAGMVGVARAYERDRRRVVGLAISTALVVWVLANLWAPLFTAGYPPSAYGPLKASTLRSVPIPHVYVNDDEIYRRVFYLMHHSEGYYPAFRDAWLGLASHPPLPNSVTAYRLPTLFWIWRLLPPDPFAIVALWLAFVSIGVVAAAFIAGQLAGVRAAPLAAAALAAYAIGSGRTVYVTYVDLPAACLVLVGVALLVRSLTSPDRRLLWAAVVVVTCAALMREILAYVIVLALLATLLEPAEERLRKAVPWLISLTIFALAYAAHAYALRDMIAPDSGALSYLKGGPTFALDALTRFADRMNGAGGLLVVLVVLGVAGAAASQRRVGLPFAAFASAAILAPLLVMLRIGNPGIDAAGNHINYWGNLFVPLALALWPAWALWFTTESTPDDRST